MPKISVDELRKVASNIAFNPNKQCRIEGCTRRVECRALCTMHYQRFQKHGDPLYERPK